MQIGSEKKEKKISQKKKLKKNQIKKLDSAIKTIMANPEIGDLKKGDLQGIRVYKYKVGNNLVLLAFLDGLQHIFLDYKNVENYANFKSYRDNYLIDLKANYGLEENYSLSDLDPILSELIANKKKEDFLYAQFGLNHKL